MVGGKDVVRVLNRPAFHDTNLVCSGDLAYLGGSWSKTVGSAVSLFLTLPMINLSFVFPSFMTFRFLCHLKYDIVAQKRNSSLLRKKCFTGYCMNGVPHHF